MSAPSSSSHHWVVVEVWRNGQLAATPATMHTSTGGATASSFSLTTAANDSVISWLAYDNESTENNISVFPHVYSPRAYETGWPPAANGNGVWYSAAQQAPTAGSNGFGLSAPSTSEIQKLSSGVAQGGVAGLGLGSTSTPRKVAVEGGSGAVGLASTSSPRKRAVQTGAAAVGFGSSSTPRKVAVTGGRAVFGLTSTGLQSTLVSRAVSGLLAFALGSSSTPRKVAVEGGAGAVGLASTSTPRKRAVEGGAAAVGLASTSTPRKRAVEGGVAAVGLGSSSSPRKRAAAAGRALLGLTGTGVILPPIVRGSMRAAARATAGMRAAARAVTTMRKG